MSRTATEDPRQSELLELQKKYRTMELNRRQYAEESQALLRKQQVTIDKLRKDNDGIKGDIAINKASVQKRHSEKMFVVDPSELVKGPIIGRIIKIWGLGESGQTFGVYIIN